MHEDCPACGLHFEREPGYFLGAMYISYILGVGMIVLFAVTLWVVTGWWITKSTIWAIVLFLPLAPAITYFSRYCGFIWISILIRRGSQVQVRVAMMFDLSTGFQRGNLGLANQ